MDQRETTLEYEMHLLILANLSFECCINLILLHKSMLQNALFILIRNIFLNMN